MGERPGEIGRYEREVVVSDVDVTAVPERPQDPAEIHAEIEQTRAEMSETIDAIQERLSPQHLKEQAKETVREQFTEAKDYVYDATIGRAEQTAKGIRTSMIDTMKQHPIPAALAGLSLGYLFMKGSSSSSSNQERYQSYSSGGSSSGGTQQHASRMAGQARNTAEQIGHEAMDQASYYADQAQQQAQETTDWLQQQLHQNPLAVGAIALAVGAAVGLTMPETQTENQWMGEARDSLMQQAKSMGQDAMHKVQHVAAEAKDTAKQVAEEQGLTG